MKIIRDDEFGGLMMIPLLVDWNIRRCNVKGCTSKPNTIVAQLADDVPICGFCEEHYQKGKEEGGWKLTLVFDNFDAFKQDPTPPVDSPSGNPPPPRRRER